MTGDQYAKALETVGLSATKAGPFFGYAERQGFRWKTHGPPPAVAKMLQFMIALGFTAADVDKRLAKPKRARKSG
jgi:hypothetical protein